MGKLFGTDGIRGVANEYPLTPEVLTNLGRAVAHIFKRDKKNPKIVIGRDTRVSGRMIEDALVSGICSMGVDAVMVGIMPTPGIAFITSSMRADAGIVISASHNPYHDNGIKIFSENGLKLPDEEEEEIEALILSEKIDELHAEPPKLGKTYNLDDAGDRYIEFLKRTLAGEYTLGDMKIGLDCANGATYQIAPELFFELGADVKALFINPDGKNINDNCGSQHPEELAGEVVRNKLDVGLAFDGDGDRLIAVDEKGDVLTGDHIIAICAKVLKDEGKLPNNLVVTTVMSNIGFGIALKELGIRYVTTQVGDRYVLEEMLAKGAIIGGEQSGHIIFLDHHTTGDGMLTALQLLAAMKKENKPLSELAKLITVYPQVLINVTVREKPDIETVPEIVKAIKEVEEKLGEKGRVLVRYSGTQPMCRVMVEGPTQKETEKYCRQLSDLVKKKLG